MTLAVPVLTKADARKLTRRIKTTGEVLWALLAEAHDGQAWKVLGHSSFKTYCAVEFGMNERTAFRVLDQGKVAKALTAAANQPVVVSQRQAAAVKPHLGEAVERIESGEVPTEVVEELAKPQDLPPKVSVEPSSETEGDGRAFAAAPSNPQPRTPAQDPIPREPGEEATATPLAVASPVSPAKSGGEASAPRASRASLSASSTVSDPTDLVKALVRLTDKEWEAVPIPLVGALASACRRRLGADVAPDPTMRTRPKAQAKQAAKRAPGKTDCRHPSNRLIGEKRDFCAECSQKIA